MRAGGIGVVGGRGRVAKTKIVGVSVGTKLERRVVREVEPGIVGGGRGAGVGAEGSSG